VGQVGEWIAKLSQAMASHLLTSNYLPWPSFLEDKQISFVSISVFKFDLKQLINTAQSLEFFSNWKTKE